MFDIYVINLEERTDRWNSLKERFKDFNLIRVNAIKTKNGATGCFLSHLECIKIAKSKNLKNILVIEDDCMPFYDENNFVNRLGKIKNILDLYEDWDIFLGGPNKVFSHDVLDSLNIDGENFVKVNVGTSTHMICYNKKVYDFYLNSDPYNGIPIDKCWHNKCIALIPVPYIAAQQEGFSNIENLPKSYERRTQSSNKSLLKYIKEKNNQ